jgi:hypothetical protein
MKAKTFLTVVLITVFLALVSCNQGPIFHTISTGTPPLQPLISGSPTNMVLFNRVVLVPDPQGGPAQIKPVPVLYVASGGLYWYGLDDDGISSKWGLDKYSIPHPGGKIIALAVTSDYLYALCLTGHNVNTDLKRIENDPEKGWENVGLESGGYPLIQSIHADPASGRLFAGARQNSSTKEVYAVLYLDDSSDTPVLRILKSDTAVLSGAVYQGGYHYLSTNGGGVFRVAETVLNANNVGNPDPLPETGTDAANNSRHFMGMIKLKDNTIIAVERKDGALYEIKSGSFEQMKNPSNGEPIATGRYATGALALWEGTDSSGSPIELLVAGIQGGLYNTTTTSYTYGYVEFDLNEDGSLNKDTPRRDQGSLKSVSDNNRYTASIGKHSINHLFQAPKEVEVDEPRTFFASTQIAGLWSYRDRNDGNGFQWNAETKPD